MLRSALCTFNATCAFKACTRLFSLLIPYSFGLDLPVTKTFATIADTDIRAGVYPCPSIVQGTYICQAVCTYDKIYPLWERRQSHSIWNSSFAPWPTRRGCGC